LIDAFPDYVSEYGPTSRFPAYWCGVPLVALSI
jgi:hypothetical protein